MNTWKEEDEFESGDSEGDDTMSLPDGVMSRINSYAERTGAKVEDATQKCLDYIAEEYGCQNPKEEDEDLLLDWSEQVFVQTRKDKKSASKLSQWVGCFVGIAPQKKDRLKTSWRITPRNSVKTLRGH